MVRLVYYLIAYIKHITKSLTKNSYLNKDKICSIILDYD